MISSIAILYICTGKYSALWEGFYESAEQYLCPQTAKDYYVFTDSPEQIKRNDERVHCIYQEALPWPYPSLLRFSMFNRIEEQLVKYDYVFFFNANAQILQPISETMILPRKEKKEQYVFVKHPSTFWNNLDFPYDRNWKCKAFIPFGLGKIYVQASIIGGTSKAFLKMSNAIDRKIQRDLKHNIIALWHDESYVNRFILFRKDYRLLGKGFACQNAGTQESSFILMRNKEQFFDVGKVKNDAPKTSISTFETFFNKSLFYLIVKARELSERIKHKR